MTGIERTFLLLLLLLSGYKTLTELLLLLVEACGVFWRDVGERWSSSWAFHDSTSRKGARAGSHRARNRQNAACTTTGTSREHCDRTVLVKVSSGYNWPLNGSVRKQKIHTLVDDEGLSSEDLSEVAARLVIHASLGSFPSSPVLQLSLLAHA
jgi:hypothetical protein